MNGENPVTDAVPPLYTGAYTLSGDAITTRVTTRLMTVPICPDLLDYSALGGADRLRGRVVRAFFWLIRWWK